MNQSDESLHWALSGARDLTTVDQLVGLSGTSYTSLLMQIARQRASRVPVSQLLSRYRRNRFVRPNPVPALALRRVEDAFIEVSCANFELVALAPVVPFAMHAQLTGISQNRLVSALRDLEVAADPTVGLALEAALQRQRVPRSALPVQLAAIQRVTRAQHFSGSGSFAHFVLAALVTAQRDTGDNQVEAQAVVEHSRTYAAVLQSLGQTQVAVVLSDFADRPTSFVDGLAEELARTSTIEVSVDPTRTAGSGYYSGLCFKILTGPTKSEVGDGGAVNWTASLTHSRKERCFTSGISLERIALLVVGA